MIIEVQEEHKRFMLTKVTALWKPSGAIAIRSTAIYLIKKCSKLNSDQSRSDSGSILPSKVTLPYA